MSTIKQTDSIILSLFTVNLVMPLTIDTNFNAPEPNEKTACEVELMSSPSVMEILLLKREMRELAAPGNFTCSLDRFLPQNLSTALAPIVLWIATVLIGSLYPLCAASGLSIQRSIRELFSNRRSRLDVLDVFRVVAIMWVMVNHTGSEGRIDILERLPSAEPFKAAVHNHPIFGALLGNSALGVEIFLVLSGLLAARSWLRAADLPFTEHYKSFLLKRVIRLAPSMFFFVYIASGPIMKSLLPRYFSSMVSACTGWSLASHLTFLSNWQTMPTCMGYLWYLGLDMQLYLAAPFLLHVLNSNPRFVSTVVIPALILVSSVCRAVYCISYDVCNQSDVDIPFISFPGVDPESQKAIYAGIWDMYSRPMTKCGPYLIGLLAGYVLTTAPKMTIPIRVSNLIFCSSLAVAVLTVYGILPEYWWPHMGSNLYNVLYTSLFRNIFALAIVGMLLSLCYREKELEVSWYFSVMARLTFNAYLLHMPIIYIFNHLSFLQEAQGAMELIAVVPFVAALSFIAAAVFYVFVEAPLGNISSLWLQKAGY